MPVLEITHLRLKEVTADDPALLMSLSKVRSQLQTSSVFYACIEDPSLIIILGIWSTLEAHHQFLASPARNEILGPQEHLLDFISTVHMHLDAMTSLPLDAPVLALERRFIKPDYVDEYNQAVTNTLGLLTEASIPYNVVNGWRCDSSPIHSEAVVFTGWPSLEAHVTFAEKTRHLAGSSAIRKLYGSFPHLTEHPQYQLFQIQPVELGHSSLLESSSSEEPCLYIYRPKVWHARNMEKYDQ